jgi:hypothetical protein
LMCTNASPAVAGGERERRMCCLAGVRTGGVVHGVVQRDPLALTGTQTFDVGEGDVARAVDCRGVSPMFDSRRTRRATDCCEPSAWTRTFGSPRQLKQHVSLVYGIEKGCRRTGTPLDPRILRLVPLARGARRDRARSRVHLPVRVVLERGRVRARGHAHRLPHVVRAGVALAVPRVAHEDVRRLRGARECQHERALRVVGVRGLGGDVRGARPCIGSVCELLARRRQWRHTWAGEVRGPEDFVWVWPVASLRRGDEEVGACQ